MRLHLSLPLPLLFGPVAERRQRELSRRQSGWFPQGMPLLAAKSIGADIVELHTGHFCDLYEKKDKDYIRVTKTLEKAAKYANKLGLEVHAGHGLTTRSVSYISKIAEIKELNIGHSIISDSIFMGLRGAIELMKQRIKESRF